MPPEKPTRKSPCIATIDISSDEGSSNETEAGGAGEPTPPVVATVNTEEPNPSIVGPTGVGEPTPPVVKTATASGTQESDQTAATARKEDDGTEDLSALMKGGAVSCDGLNVTYDSSGEANLRATKVPPSLTPSLLKRATEAVRDALTSTNKATQDVEGDSNDLSVGEIP